MPLRKTLLFLLLISSDVLFSQEETLLIPYRKGTLWGFADTTGKIVIQPEYDEVDFFLNGQAKVSKNEIIGSNTKEKYGFVNTKGEVIIPIIYDYIGESRYDIYLCHKNQKEGLIIKDTVVIVAEQDEVNFNIHDKSTVFIQVKKSGKVGVLKYHNRKLSTLIPSEYIKIEDHYSKNNLTFKCTKQNSTVVVFDHNGKIFVPKKDEIKPKQNTVQSGEEEPNIEITEIGSSSEVKKNGIVPNPNDIKFSKNSKPIHYYISQNGKKGLITISPALDNKGNVTAIFDTIPPIYDDIDTNLQDKDVAFVKLGENNGIVDKKGNVVLELVYPYLDKFVLRDEDYSKTNYLILTRNGKRGVVEIKKQVENNTEGYTNTIKIPFEYDDIYTDYYEFFILEKEQKSGVYDIYREKLVVPIKYIYLDPYGFSPKTYKLFATKKFIPGTVFIGQNGVEFFSE